MKRLRGRTIPFMGTAVAMFPTHVMNIAAVIQTVMARISHIVWRRPTKIRIGLNMILQEDIAQTQRIQTEEEPSLIGL